MLNCNTCPVYQNCFSYFVKSRDSEIFDKEVKKLQFKKNSLIYSNGQFAENIYMIISGEVRLLKEDDLPYPVTMYIAHPGEFIGVAAMAIKNYFTTATALSDSTICVFNRYVISEILNKSSENNQLFIRSLFNQIKNISDFSVAMVTGISLSKVAKALMILKNKDDKIFITKEEIASMIGSTRETVSRTINKLKREGILNINRKTITIIDKEKLLELSKETRKN
ncbi:MAG: Crp/Fnr family transcriptional regulator [Bacteroidetes bacterium]|nr:Crp/Fnr family transcriptional regulator [Bacteroidota bacterium]